MNTCKTIRAVAIFLLFAGTTATLASEKYWVKLTDKAHNNFSLSEPQYFLTERSLERRRKQGIPIDSTDLPVSQVYIDSIRNTGCKILCTSKWLNAVTIESTGSEQIEQIRSFQFVDTLLLSWINPTTKSAYLKLENHVSKLTSDTLPSFYGPSYTQITLHNGDKLHQMGYTGQGMLIAVLDAGFLNADIVPSLSHLYANEKVIGTHDFVNPTSNIYDEHYHGMEVLSTIAGYEPGILVGTAFDASFYLIRTEDAASEQPVEMDYWVAGAELADSIGADLINSSLGYYYWDEPFTDYVFQDMDGETLRSSIGAAIAAKKGMIITSSAGNEGNVVGYGKIVSPSDAKGVVCVGSVGNRVDENGNNTMVKDSIYTPFSSRGYSADGRIKPNVVAKGYLSVVQYPDLSYGYNNGTSFSSPIMCGLLATLWQALPHYKASEIIELVEQNSHQYLNPDIYLGNGIPDMYQALNIATSIPDTILDDILVYPNPFDKKIQFIIPENAGNIDVSVYSITGKLVKILVNIPAQKRYQLDTGLLPQGMYILKVNTSDGKYTQKILKR